ncbi:MAG: SUMF1/EgtB/PvdO family nonheme iron enzyme [Lewinellaceae bacterium]|nr:SUMF1/EgtB/PvdO family nonheme iron enzyme [Lewinellaceae bacterium]
MKQEKPLSIFINYRRDDCQDEAEQLYGLLRQAFGETAVVFLDKKAIQLTDKWKEEINRALASAEVLLSLIGPKWVSSFSGKAANEETAKANDWVLYEIETALAERVDIVPVFFFPDKAATPENLPEGFPAAAALVMDRQGIDIKKGHFKAGASDLIQSLRALMGHHLNPHETIRAPVALPPLASLPLNRQKYLGKLYELDEEGEPKITSPFLGPIYYPEEKAALYFGREREIRSLYHLVRRNRLLLLHGYSGSGKSSLLHAGLIPRMKDIEKWRMLPPLRRNKEEGGLPNQLERMWRDEQPLPAGKRLLCILDQVEEMYTDPLARSAGEETEIEALGKRLAAMKAQYPQLHFILAFRSEFLPKISNEFLSRHGLFDSYDSLYLRGLDEQGVISAIEGPARDEGLRKKFRYGITDSALPRKIARDFTGDDFSPHTVLLQIHLVELWKAAAEQAEKEQAWDVSFTTALYDALPRKGLADFIEGALREIQTDEHWEKAYQDGLLWDVLYRFTSARDTAASQDNQNFLHQYRHLEHPTAGEILQRLKQKYLLSAAGKNGQATRMAHDSLAPPVRAKFQASNAAGLRAWRIVEAKRGDLRDNRSFRFSESDVETILAGRYGMPAQEGSLWEKVEKDREYYQSLREHNFQLAFSKAVHNIEHLEFEEAVANLNTAHREGLYPEKVREKARELPYPLAFLGAVQSSVFKVRGRTGKQQFTTEGTQVHEHAPFLQAKAQLEQALQLILDISEGQDGHWAELQALAPSLPPDHLFQEIEAWLQKKDEPLYHQMRQRFFPNMVDVPGGTFEMGSNVEWFSQENPPHTVTVADFQLADTPVTCWQYGLYCLATGQSLPRDSGFGRGNKPVVNVSWYEAIAYLNWLSRQMGFAPAYPIEDMPADPNELDGRSLNWTEIIDWKAGGFCLPTEAEWEFAAGSGAENRTVFGNSRNVADPTQMNFDCGHVQNSYAVQKDWMEQSKIRRDDFRGATTPVKEFDKNALGLYDMSGNVFEWCWDWYDENYYKNSPSENPKGPESGTYRSVRGGSWYNFALGCRAAFRYRYDPFFQDANLGVRVSRRP